MLINTVKRTDKTFAFSEQGIAAMQIINAINSHEKSCVCDSHIKREDAERLCAGSDLKIIAKPYYQGWRLCAVNGYKFSEALENSIGALWVHPEHIEIVVNWSRELVEKAINILSN